MRLRGRQARFVVGSLAAWVGVRAGAWWGGVALAGLAGLVGLSAIEHFAPWSDAVASPSFQPARGRPLRLAPTPQPVPVSQIRAQADAPAPARSAGLLRLALGGGHPGSVGAVLRRATFAAPSDPEEDEAPPADRPAGLASLAGRTSASRWSATLYAYGRPGHGGASLADGGQLGGSQLAVRLAYQLNRRGPVRTAAAARLYVPLGAKGAEAAAGIDWYPKGGIPLRLSVERRVGLDRAGRDAWSAYAAGGFYREGEGGRLVVDGYGQAGVVGVHSRDPFVDGAVRVGAKVALGPTSLIAGGGIWGAAQPDLARLDLGPRAALTVPVAGRAFTIAVEGRFRVAGRARPGSGVALTLGADL